jgi:guanylate kinase
MSGAGRPTAEGRPGALLVIISGPSGVGKDTIIAAMKARAARDDRHYVITCTTRARRTGEVDGVSYHFLGQAAFDRLRASGGLLEASEVHGNWYGTPRDQVEEALMSGRDAILKIDVQGAGRVREVVPEALLIFVVPPSLDALEERLVGRSTETEAQLRRRRADAARELARRDDYDHVVVNETGQAERTAEAIDAIIAEAHRRYADRRIRL